MDKVWVLTSEINEYDQAGEYFEAVFINKPTAEQIQIHCNLSEASMEEDQLISHILGGGGRVGDEYIWYHLRQEDAGPMKEKNNG